MIVSFARCENGIPQLFIDGLPLDLVTSFKTLGSTMNNKLNWQDNTEALVKKASKRLYIIRVLQRCGLSPSDLLLVYFFMVYLISGNQLCYHIATVMAFLISKHFVTGKLK